MVCGGTQAAYHQELTGEFVQPSLRTASGVGEISVVRWCLNLSLKDTSQWIWQLIYLQTYLFGINRELGRAEWSNGSQRTFLFSSGRSFPFIFNEVPQGLDWGQVRGSHVEWSEGWTASLSASFCENPGTFTRGSAQSSKVDWGWIFYPVGWMELRGLTCLTRVWSLGREDPLEESNMSEWLSMHTQRETKQYDTSHAVETIRLHSQIRQPTSQI